MRIFYLAGPEYTVGEHTGGMVPSAKSGELVEMLEAREEAETPDRVLEVGYEFDRLDAETINATVEDKVQRANGLVERILAETEPTFGGTIARLDEICDLAGWGGMEYGREEFLISETHPDEAVRKAAENGKLRLSSYYTDLFFREDVYRQAKAFSESGAAQALEGEQALLLGATMREFRSAGQELDLRKRERLAAVRKELHEDCAEYTRNIREGGTTLGFTFEDLSGTPLTDILEKNADGTYMVSLSTPNYTRIMQQAENRTTREQMFRAYQNIAAGPNRQLLADIVEKRREIAVDLLGHQSWADYRLGDYMAGTPEAVEGFYGQLMDPLTAKARAEAAVMTKMLHEDGHEGPLQQYDVAYYTSKIKELDFGVNPEQVREYLSLDSVMKGFFGVTAETFGLKYREVEDARAWHPDVRAYAIDDATTGKQLALFHMDLHPRDKKYSHAAAFPIQVGRRMPDGQYRMPVSAIVANFPRPTTDKPALLNEQEKNTFWHELGHVLHMSVTTAETSRFSGAAVPQDFVEAPSQIMEHWAKSPEILSRFAKHYQTGTLIPPDLIKGLAASEGLNKGLHYTRQMQFGLFDVALHNRKTPKDIDAITRQATAVSTLAYIEGTFWPGRIGHWVGGYDAGYYGYMWSKVYGDDMFSAFEAEGLTNTNVGQRYRRNILAPGGSRNLRGMLRDFLGREPNNQAFLRDLGIEA